MSESGLLVEVKWEWDGTEVLVDTTSGNDEIVVENITALTEEGLIWIAEEGPYTITNLDEDTATITVSPSLTSDVEEGDPIVPDVGGTPAKVWVAIVILPDSDEPVEVPLTVFNLAVMPEGTYDPPRNIILADDLASVIDLPGTDPQVSGEYIPPGTIDIPGQVVPEVSPVPVPVPGPASVVVNYEPIDYQWADLYVWVPPALEEGETVFDTPPAVSVDELTIERFPPGGFVYVDKNGDPLPEDRPVWVALWGRNELGEAPAASAWVESAVGQIDPAYLNLLAGSIIAQRLQSQTLQSVTITASILDITDALYAEPGYLEVKANLLEAQSAVFFGNVTRRGTNNFLVGRELVAAGVTDPGTPPTVTSVWPSVQLAGPPSTLITGMTVDTVTEEVFVLFSTSRTLKVYDLVTGAFIRDVVLDYSPPGSGISTFDITMDDDYFYVVFYDSTSTNVRCRQFLRTGTEGDAGPMPEISIISRAVVAGTDSVAIGLSASPYRLHAILLQSPAPPYSLNYRYARYNPSTGATELALTTTGLASAAPGLGGITRVDTIGIGDYRLYVQPQSYDRFTYDTVADTADAGTRGRAMGEAVKGTDGMYSITSAGVLYEYTRDDDTLGELDYQYTWYDSDPLGLGTAESGPSPVRAYEALKGAFINIVTPLPPDDGTNDAPDTVRVYVEEVSQDPEYTTGELSTGRTLDTPDLISGDPIPTSSDFDARPATTPGGSESTVEDADGPIWELNGSGDGRTGPLKWDEGGYVEKTPVPIGTLLPFAGAEAMVPADFLPCDGTAVSRTTYADLWDVLRNGTSSSPYGNGNGSTTFNLPDTRVRYIMGAGDAGTGFWELGTSESSSSDQTERNTRAGHTHSHSTPNHTHTTGGPSGLVRRVSEAGADNAAGTAHTHTIASSGGGTTGSASGIGAGTVHAALSFTMMIKALK